MKSANIPNRLRGSRLARNHGSSFSAFAALFPRMLPSPELFGSQGMVYSPSSRSCKTWECYCTNQDSGHQEAYLMGQRNEFPFADACISLHCSAVL